jgi:hypothetical protein
MGRWDQFELVGSQQGNSTPKPQPLPYSPYGYNVNPPSVDPAAIATKGINAYEGAQKSFRENVPIANYVPDIVKEKLDTPGMSIAARKWAETPISPDHNGFVEGAKQTAMSYMNLPAKVSPALTGFFTDPTKTALYANSLLTDQALEQRRILDDVQGGGFAHTLATEAANIVGQAIPAIAVPALRGTHVIAKNVIDDYASGRTGQNNPLSSPTDEDRRNRLSSAMKENMISMVFTALGAGGATDVGASLHSAGGLTPKALQLARDVVEESVESVTKRILSPDFMNESKLAEIGAKQQKDGTFIYRGISLRLQDGKIFKVGYNK